MSAASRLDLPLPCGPVIWPQPPVSSSRAASDAGLPPGGKRKGIVPGAVKRVEKGLMRGRTPVRGMVLKVGDSLRESRGAVC